MLFVLVFKYMILGKGFMWNIKDDDMTGKIGMKKGFIKKTCSKCDEKLDRKNSRYCKKCHNEHTRLWRKENPLTPEQRFKSNVRRLTNMRLQRGLMDRYPCHICGNEKAEAHHDDYNKPYCVRWLCRTHHLEHHKNEQYKAKELPGTERIPRMQGFL